MEIWLLIAIGAVVIGGGAVVLISRGKKQEVSKIRKEEKVAEEEYEIIEEDAPIPGFTIEEETEEGCPEKVKKRLKDTQQQLFKEAHKVYLVINNMLQNKKLSPELKKEFDTFIRSYNRLKEMEEEIEVYPFSDCDRVFQLKFNFYNKLIKDTAKKIMILAKSAR